MLLKNSGWVDVNAQFGLYNEASMALALALVVAQAVVLTHRCQGCADGIQTLIRQSSREAPSDLTEVKCVSDHIGALLLAVGLCSTSLAAADDVPADIAAKIRATLHERIPDLKVEGVHKSPVPGCMSSIPATSSSTRTMQAP